MTTKQSSRECPVCGRKPPYGRTFHKVCAIRKARALTERLPNRSKP